MTGLWLLLAVVSAVAVYQLIRLPLDRRAQDRHTRELRQLYDEDLRRRREIYRAQGGPR